MFFPLYEYPHGPFPCLLFPGASNASLVSSTGGESKCTKCCLAPEPDESDQEITACS